VSSSDELFADFGMVINFTIEGYNSAAVFTEEGLISSLEINDLQTNCAQGYIRSFIDSALIRPAMHKLTNSLADAIRDCDLISMREPSQSTQVVFCPPLFDQTHQGDVDSDLNVLGSVASSVFQNKVSGDCDNHGADYD